MPSSIETITERYLATVTGLEDAAVSRINSSLDAAFRSLTRELLAKYSKQSSLESTLNEAERLRVLNKLLKDVDPANTRGYRLIFEDLILRATEAGLDYADQLTSAIAPSGFQAKTLDIPIEAIKQASLSATQYLQRWGQTYADTVTTIIGQALAEGQGIQPTAKMLRQTVAERFPDLAFKTKVLQARAENIARTESIKAANSASLAYYAKNGADLVVWIATGDDRVCPYCSARAGNVYRREQVLPLLHCRCRCTQIGVNPDWLAIDDAILADAKVHRREVMRKFTGATEAGPAPFERGSKYHPGSPTPSPVWTPRQGWLDKDLETYVAAERAALV